MKTKNQIIELLRTTNSIQDQIEIVGREVFADVQNKVLPKLGKTLSFDERKKLFDDMDEIEKKWNDIIDISKNLEILPDDFFPFSFQIAILKISHALLFDWIKERGKENIVIINVDEVENNIRNMMRNN